MWVFYDKGKLSNLLRIKINAEQNQFNLCTLPSILSIFQEDITISKVGIFQLEKLNLDNE